MFIKYGMDKPSNKGELMNKYVTYVAVIAAIVLVLLATFVYVNMQNNNGLQPTPTPFQSIVLTDDEGFNTTLDAYPQRIVSLAPGNTQILFAVGAGAKVVGLTDYDNYPYNFSAWIESGNMTSIGGYSTPNKEAIVSLQPDLILATPIVNADVATLRSLGYKVIVINSRNVQGVLEDITLVGRAVGTDAKAAELVASINSQIDNVSAKIAAANITERAKVYYEIWGPPAGDMMSAGGTSWVNDLISKAGGINIFANEADQWPTISSETVVQKNPDVIILPTGMGMGSFYGSVDQVKARSGWNSMSAIVNNRVVVIDGDLFAEVGPRIGEQINTIAKALYPSLFNSP
jgi:iron complex transport system substrate-binding protein